jgi:hypothetical protein
MLDPCCGSGHFLVAAFNLLVPLRMHDEGLSARVAADSVLRENLYGLELDPRCTQIAAFALALAAWKYPSKDGEPLGYRPLPPLNIACSGQGVVGMKEEWTKFANADSRFRQGMERLYDLFRRATTLGSLIDPRNVADDLFALGFDTLKGTLDRTLKRLETESDPDRAVVGVVAQGIALAASVMAREFTLVATNVPYLARGKQSEELRDYISDVHPSAKADLATAFVERCMEYCAVGGSTALVTPQNWLFLGSYRALREHLLRQVTWDVVAKLGPGAFETISGEVVNVALMIHSATFPIDEHQLVGFDGYEARQPDQKARILQQTAIKMVMQSNQIANPDSKIVLELEEPGTPLREYATAQAGILNGDSPRFRRCFWEVQEFGDAWSYLQSTVETTAHYGGREGIILWERGDGQLRALAAELRERLHDADRRGNQLWGKRGVVISAMNSLPATLYGGDLFDNNTFVISPFDRSYLPAIWSFCSTPHFVQSVRRYNQKLSVEPRDLISVCFDLDYWRKVAAERYPKGLPEPQSDDPTQWLFKGHPKGSTDPLQIAVARLLGYRWPDQEPDGLDSLTDPDGIVPIPAVRSEPPAAERLHEVLLAAFGSEWSASLLDKYLTDSGCRPGTSLYDWLRDSFFEQHCRRFHNRPFIWHIWDGRKDGFSCLVNCHKLNHKALESLTYAYVQDWINTQAAAAKQSRTGADLRLKAAQDLQDKLKLILAGEPPHDIFVRWKPLAEQPIGWNPDLNDGVRLNIRPFMTAGVLRKNPNIKWTKDRGTEPERPRDQFPWFWIGDTFKGERVNDVHLANTEKQAARGAKVVQ